MRRAYSYWVCIWVYMRNGFSRIESSPVPLGLPRVGKGYLLCGRVGFCIWAFLAALWVVFSLSLGYLRLIAYGCIARVCVGVILGGRIIWAAGARWAVFSSVRRLGGWAFGRCIW